MLKYCSKTMCTHSKWVNEQMLKYNLDKNTLLFLSVPLCVKPSSTLTCNDTFTTWVTATKISGTQMCLVSKCLVFASKL